MGSIRNVMLTGLLCSLLLGLAHAGEKSYPVSAIPSSLRDNANAVIRHDEGLFEVKAIDKAKRKVKMVVTVFNKQGSDFALLNVGYDKLSKINYIKGIVYDQYGNEIKSAKKSDIGDVSNVSGFSLYEDNRLKYLDLRQKTYPYTVEFEYEVVYKFLYWIPDWYVIPDENVSVEHSKYVVTAPEGLKPRFRNVNFEGNYTETESGGFVKMEWAFENYKAVEYEPFSNSWRELTPIVYLSPAKFEYEGYRGDMSSWDGLAEWQNQLNEGRDELSPETIAKVNQLTAGLETDEEKIRVIYEYLQSKTRYVSIQLGIGGWQPFEAKVVDEVGYGDCKALSFYTHSMLAAAGINSHYTLVSAGRNPRPIMEDFPMRNFNHAILCVPNKGDTIWLECTSQTNPFGYSGSFTGDRDVLLITEEGGKIVRTPVYEQDDNTQHRVADVYLSKDGNATAEVNTAYSGLQYENGRLDDMLYEGSEEQKKWLYRFVDIPSFEIKDFELSQDKGRIPTAQVALSLNLKRLASVSGKRVFLSPNLMNKISYIPPAVEDRKTDVVFRNAYYDSDTVRYHIPEGIHPEYVPEPVSITSQFGEYNAEVTVEQGVVTYIRTYKTNKGIFPPESYNEYIDFKKKVVKADKVKLVFLSKS
ncbi:MAG: DUF3857 domain-containing protein [Bacteroidota bacterium]